ncbi:TPA: hypothetical protein QCS28_004900 [Bacillus thuringiensis]|nr:hypothetical protein [Bacillus thuringiensis]HDR7785296.1 hypothetical protein [Bacillus wiedmannii]
MFKKLIVGALATGIALTGGIGAASASTETFDKNSNSKTELNSLASSTVYKMEMRKQERIFINTFTDPTTRITWYLKDIIYDYDTKEWVGKYEGRIYK